MGSSSEVVMKSKGEPTSTFELDRAEKDKKLAAILKKLDQDLKEDTLNGTESASIGSNGSAKEQIAPKNSSLVGSMDGTLSSRNRPRKILDYALLVKGMAAIDKDSRYMVTNQNSVSAKQENGKRNRKSANRQKSSSGCKNARKEIKHRFLSTKIEKEVVKRYNKKNAKNFSEAFAITKSSLAAYLKTSENFTLPKAWLKGNKKTSSACNKKADGTATSRKNDIFSGCRSVKNETKSDQYEVENQEKNMNSVAQQKALKTGAYVAPRMQKSTHGERLKRRKEDTENEKIKIENDVEDVAERQMSGNTYKPEKEPIVVAAQALTSSENILAAEKSGVGDTVGKKVMRILRASLIKARNMYPEDFMASFGHLDLHLDSEVLSTEGAEFVDDVVAHHQTNRRTSNSKKKSTLSIAADDILGVATVKPNEPIKNDANCCTSIGSENSATSASTSGKGIAGLQKRNRRTKPSTSSNVACSKTLPSVVTGVPKCNSRNANKIRESLVGKPPLFGRIIHNQDAMPAVKRARKSSLNTNGDAQSTSTACSEKREATDTSSDDMNLRVSKRRRAGSGFYRLMITQTRISP